jgi:hypothetical protein
MRLIPYALLLALALVGVPSTTTTASAGPALRATGEFAADVDFTSLTATPRANGRHCELVVQGTLSFSGTLSGVAEGTTTALVLAPCNEALAVPPGTFRDGFRFSGVFAGTVDGTAATGELTYAGVTRPGGDIDATIRLRGGSNAVLRAAATVAVGGTYTGVVKS